MLELFLLIVIVLTDAQPTNLVLPVDPIETRGYRFLAVKFSGIFPIINNQDTGDRSISTVKIQEFLYQPLSLNTMDLSKKANPSSTSQPENGGDSYVIGGEGSYIEKEVLQVLKGITRDFVNTVNELSVNDQNADFPDVQVALSGKPGMPVAEHTIIMLFLSGKGEAPVDLSKTFLSYKAGGTSSEMSVTPAFIGKVVEEAKQIVNSSIEKGAFVVEETKENDTDSSAESGFVIQFSFFSQTPDKESMASSPPITAPSAPKDGAAQVHESIITYHVSGKMIDGQYLSSLSLHTEEEGEIIKKLLLFVSNAPSDTKQAESGETDVKSQESLTVEQDNKSKPITASKHMTVGVPFQPVRGKDDRLVVSFDTSDEKGQKTHILVVQAKNTNEFIGDKNMELKGTVLEAGFGQGELISSPIAGPPPLPVNNNLIVGKAVKFIDELNALVNGDGNSDEAAGETSPDGAIASGVSLEKLRMLQARSPEARAAVQNEVKKIFSEFYYMPDSELIGFSREKNGLFHLDTATLISELTSKKEQTMNAMKGLGNTFYERINYLMYPYAGMYIDDKSILQLRAAQKDERASLLDKQLEKDQGVLEKRLNALQLLIDGSTLFKEWLTEEGSMPNEDLGVGDGFP